MNHLIKHDDYQLVILDINLKSMAGWFISYVNEIKNKDPYQTAGIHYVW